MLLPVGELQLIAFYVATTPRRGSAASGKLVPVPGPVTVAGSPIRSMTFFPGREGLLIARANGDLALLAPDDGKLQTWATLDSPAKSQRNQAPRFGMRLWCPTHSQRRKWMRETSRAKICGSE